MSGSVILTFPAEASHVSLARSVAATMSARADLPLDQLEDVRLAVDEAVSQLIADAVPGSDVTLAFLPTGTGLAITASAPSRSAAVPSTGTFSWVVLSALVDEAAASVDGGVLTLRLRVVRDVSIDA